MKGNKSFVIGGGAAGIKAALDESKKGREVILLDECADLTSRPFLKKHEPSRSDTNDICQSVKHEKIRMLNNASVEAIRSNDKFKIKIVVRPLKVRTDKCNDCGECVKVCPVLINDSSQDNSVRTAIGRCGDNNKIYDIVREDAPPCQETCPAHLDVRGYVGFISDSKFGEALDLIRRKVPFAGVLGRICPHPCESHCSRAQADHPISICTLKRFLADHEMLVGEKAKQPVITREFSDKIAIIGSGPSGLTCAYNLAQKGFSVTVFEKLDIAGGMLRVGIPHFRLPVQVLDYEIALVQQLGVEIKLNQPIGDVATLDDLFGQGYRATYIATGAHKYQKLNIPGEDSTGILYGTNFLKDINLKNKIKVGQRVVIIGGGNVAIDCARSAIRVGAKEVSIFYRRTQEEIPSSYEEIRAACDERVKIHYLVSPIEILSKEQKVVGLKCMRMKLGDVGEDGRRKSLPIKWSEFDIECDTLIIAIGQQVDLSVLNKKNRVTVSENKAIVVDPQTCETSQSGIFAGGDAVRGPSLAISAISDGIKAAESIMNFIQKSGC